MTSAGAGASPSVVLALPRLLSYRADRQGNLSGAAPIHPPRTCAESGIEMNGLFEGAKQIVASEVTRSLGRRRRQAAQKSWVANQTPPKPAASTEPGAAATACADGKDRGDKDKSRWPRTMPPPLP